MSKFRPSVSASLFNKIILPVARTEGSLDQEDFQRRLRNEILADHELRYFVNQIHYEIERSGYVHGTLPGLATLAIPHAKFLASSLMTCFGELMKVRGTEIIVWDVMPQTSVLHESTDRIDISTRLGTADLHTDSAGTTDPEPKFALFCLNPANKGGDSVIVDSSIVLDALQAEHPIEYRQLFRERLLWRNGSNVFSRQLVWLDNGHRKIAYRSDLIEPKGETQSGSKMSGLVLFEKFISSSKYQQTIKLKADDFLLVDNQRILHGRTEFNDISRHLLRIRTR